MNAYYRPVTAKIKIPARLGARTRFVLPAVAPPLGKQPCRFTEIDVHDNEAFLAIGLPELCSPVGAHDDRRRWRSLGCVVHTGDENRVLRRTTEYRFFVKRVSRVRER